MKPIAGSAEEQRVITSWTVKGLEGVTRMTCELLEGGGQVNDRDRRQVEDCARRLLRALELPGPAG